ncbi:MAG: FAD-dependent oxidoreductase [Armatimonadetes bacterium]|nr:FAD-dependent oxidoreductase [Armatimonadota bacterium]
MRFVWASLLAFLLIGAGSAQELLPLQDFEAGPGWAGWRQADAAGQPASGWQTGPSGNGGQGNSLQSASRSEGDTFVFHPYPAQPGAHRLEFRVLSPPASDRSGVVFGLSLGSPHDLTRRGAQVLFGRGVVMFSDTIQLRPIAAYRPGVWYKVTLTADPSLGAFTLALDDGPPLAGLLPFANALPQVDTVYFNNRAIGTAGTPILLDDIRITASPGPSAPTGLTVTPLSPSSIRIRWGPPSGGPPAAYRIYRADQAIAEVPGTATGYTDTGLGAGTGYGYSVTAIDSVLLPRESLPTWPVAALTPLARDETAPRTGRYDLIVYGGTSGGIGAALAAARLGSSVAIVERSKQIGGMMSGGLGRTDYGTKSSAGGIFLEFAERVLRYYATAFGPDSRYAKETNGGYYFEPKVALGLLTRMIQENPKIEVYYEAALGKVSVSRGRVRQIEIETPQGRRRLRAPLFVDATYEGDLAALAGASYRVGRESREEFGEEHAGQIFTDMRGRKLVKGSGAGDRRVQAYNYRITLTNRPGNHAPIPRPEGYDRTRYASVLTALAQGHIRRMTDLLSMLYDLLPNDKFDVNNMPGPFPSTDLLGGSDAYPEADWQARERIIREHRDYILGLLYFCQNDPELPEAFRRDALQWGFPKDEYPDDAHFPPQLYVREARRIEGDYLFTEHDARQAKDSERAPIHSTGVAVADYPLDSHATSPMDPANPFLQEGYFFLGGGLTKPSHLPYGILLPKGIGNVLVCVAVSATHVGYSTLRLEPTYIAMGQAVGTAAHLARRYHGDPRRVPIDRLQSALLAQGQVLSVFYDVSPRTKGFAALQYLGTRGFFTTYQALPEEAATRSAAARWLWRLLTLARRDVRPQAGDRPRFKDVPLAQPDRAAIESLYRMEIIDARSYFEFMPGEPVTRAEFARWLARTREAIGPWTAPLPDSPTYLDVAPGHPDFRAIETLARKGIRSGLWEDTPAWGGGRYFLPSAALQRAEACDALYRVILEGHLFGEMREETAVLTGPP